MRGFHGENLQRRPARGNAPAEDPLVRSSNPDSMPGQLWRLKGGRSARPSITHNGPAPSTAELGAFLTCFFLSGVLLRVLMEAFFGFSGGGLIIGIIGAGFFTLLLALLFHMENESIKGFVMIMALLFAIFSCYLLYRAIRDGNWIHAGFALCNLGISGWLFSILYRQNIYEGL